MAFYKYQQFLRNWDDARFDVIYKPGDQASYSGIYRCPGCGREIAHNLNQPLPPQNHDQHAPGVPVTWRLVVETQYNAG